MKTVSAALVMCLNIGVDPPDVVKTSQCSKLECWISKLCVVLNTCKNIHLYWQINFVFPF